MQQFTERGAEVVAISADDQQKVNETIKKLRLAFTVLPDKKREAIRQYDVLHPQERISHPTTFLIDKKGFIRWKHMGQNPSDRPTVRFLLNVLAWM